MANCCIISYKTVSVRIQTAYVSAASLQMPVPKFHLVYEPQSSLFPEGGKNQYENVHSLFRIRVYSFVSVKFWRAKGGFNGLYEDICTFSSAEAVIL